MRTRTLGHPYTNGTSDSNETWVEFHADDGARALMASGTLDADKRLDPAADKIAQLVIAHDGSAMDRRQPQDIHVPLFNNFIPPGAARVVHYRFTVPKDAKGSVTLSAALNYRKFSRDYSIFVGGPDAPELPVTKISSDSVTLPVAPAPDGTLAKDVKRGNPDWPERQWIRWNDYGIGLFLQGDLKGASYAFSRVAELAADKPDGPLNLARAKLQEGDLPAAKAALAESEKRRPDWGKTQVFRALVSKEEGRLDDALADLDRVLAKFPKDRFVLNQKARVLYLAGRYAEALPFIDRVLAIDGEDLAAHYNAMLCLKALGRAEEAAAEEKWYRFFKDDESSRAVLADYRRTHPYDNRESLPIHVHDEPVPAKAERAAVDRRDRAEGLRIQSRRSAERDGPARRPADGRPAPLREARDAEDGHRTETRRRPCRSPRSRFPSESHGELSVMPESPRRDRPGGTPGRAASFVDFLVCLIVTAAWAARALPAFGTHLRDAYDAQFQAWEIAWVRHAIVHAPAHVFDANIFAPARNALAFTEPLIGYGLLGLPLGLAGLAHAGVSNVLCLLGTAFSVWAISRLAVSHGVPRLPALLGAVAAALGAQTACAFGYVSFVVGGGIALVLVAWKRLRESGRWPVAFALGAAIAALGVVFSPCLRVRPRRASSPSSSSTSRRRGRRAASRS